MMNLSTLKSLQSRIREATGADRELDALIAAAFLGGEAYHMPAGYEGFRWVRRDPVDNAVFGPAPYTTDPDGLGACVGLMREVLPGSTWERDRKGNFYIIVWSGTIYERMIGGLLNATDCLTFLDAICAALIAEEEAKLTEKAG